MTQVLSNIIYYLVFGLALLFLILRFIRVEEPGAAPVRLNRRTVVRIAAAVVLSRLALLLICWGATHVFGSGRTLFNTWNSWDANQYLAIAENGYYSADYGWTRLNFFPLYPAFVWLFHLVFADFRISALLVSWSSLCGACLYLYKLVLLDGDAKAASRAVKYLLIFPVTVFLGAPFTESLFLFFCFGCLYAARVRRFALACAYAGLAALTRSVGVLLTAPVFVEMLYAHRLIPGHFGEIVPDKLRRFAGDFKFILLVPLGTVVYLLLNHFATGDALYFLAAQRDHWHESFGSYAYSLQVAWGQIISVGDSLRNKLTLWISQFAVLLAGGLTLPVLCRKTRVSYGAYAAVYLFVVFAQTWLLSGFRYYMALAVLYPALAALTRRKWVDWALTALFVPLALAYAVCFSLHWQIL